MPDPMTSLSLQPTRLIMRNSVRPWFTGLTRPTGFVSLIFGLIGFTPPGALSAQKNLSAEESYQREIAPLLEHYCFDCHGEGISKGGLSLDSYENFTHHLTETNHWEALWKNMRSDLMPPSDEEQPTDDERAKILQWIETAALKIDPQNPYAGKVTIRRLNRDEYKNVIQDLLGVDFQTYEEFPPDDTGYGFDTIGDVLSISPLHLEKYLAAAQHIATRALPKVSQDSTAILTPLIAAHFPPSTAENTSPRHLAQTINAFATQAYRGPVSAKKITQLTALYRIGEKEAPHDSRAGYRQVLTAILASPTFLFRAEGLQTHRRVNKNPQHTSIPLDDYALASRLSFFLWGSLPDQALLDLAAQNQLRPNLAQETQRLLDDPRSQRLVRNFTGQWLRTRDVTATRLDLNKIFGIFRGNTQDLFHSDTLRDMQTETEHFVSYILHHERPAEELISANYSFLNKRLAKHYGIPGIQHDDHQKVDLSAHPFRGGLLGQGSFLVVTSSPTRTSPVQRGQFVLENILGTPAPPAPADIPGLEEAGHGKKLTIRQMMELHRANPDCRSCHARMDPIGLGLENFNALGQIRHEDPNGTLDTAGKLVTGETFSNVIELKKILSTDRKEDFYRCLSEKMLTYALGRGLTYQDATTIDALVERLTNNKGNLKELVHGIIQSIPFQNTTPPAPVTPAAQPKA